MFKAISSLSFSNNSQSFLCDGKLIRSQLYLGICGIIFNITSGWLSILL